MQLYLLEHFCYSVPFAKWASEFLSIASLILKVDADKSKIGFKKLIKLYFQNPKLSDLIMNKLKI